MTHANKNDKPSPPKVQLKYRPKDVLKVMKGLPLDPILALLKKSGSGRNLTEPEPTLLAYYLSKLPEVAIPEKPHAVLSLLKDEELDLADQCGFKTVPCWETLRTRFKLLEKEYGNQIAIRQAEILEELERRDTGKKVRTIIAKNKESKRLGQKDERNNYPRRKDAIEKSMTLREIIRAIDTKEWVGRLCSQAMWPDGKPRCLWQGCGSDRVVEEPGGQLRRWLCLDCEEPFDFTTGTVFEGARNSLETIIMGAYLMIQLRFGMPSEMLPLLLDDEGRRLSHKDAIDLTHRIQTALVERLPMFDGPAQYDSSLMGYVDGVEIHLQAIVDVPTRQVRAEVNYGPVNKEQADRFINKYLKPDGIFFTDTTKACPDAPQRREKVNHSRPVFARDSKKAEGYRVSTNMPENFWSTSQEFLGRRRAITVVYLPLYLAEHMWRCNHRHESTMEQLRALIRNSHDVVLRGDDKPCDVGEVERELAVQLELLPPSSGSSRVRIMRPRSRPKGEKDFTQLRLVR